MARNQDYCIYTCGDKGHVVGVECDERDRQFSEVQFESSSDGVGVHAGLQVHTGICRGGVEECIVSTAWEWESYAWPAMLTLYQIIWWINNHQLLFSYTSVEFLLDLQHFTSHP